MAALALFSCPAFADAVIDNVNGIALDRDGRIVQFNGLQITADGKVAKLLGKGDKRPDRLDFRMDAKGRTLIPGMIDSSAHVMDLGLALITLDLSEARSIGEAQAKIAAYAAGNPGRKWILGGGWNAETWGRMPTAADLDMVVADIPIWLTRNDGHAGWANSAALRAAGITGATKAPVGGRIEMTPARPAAPGRPAVAAAPTGLLFDAAQELMRKVVPQPLPKDRDAALEAAQQHLIAAGVTTVTDMGTVIEDWQAFRRAGDRNALRVRIIGYARGIDQALMIAGSAPTPWLYDTHLKLVGVRFALDGALGARAAWLKADYADAPRQRGAALLSSAQLRNMMTRGTMDGFQVAIHAAGDAAVNESLSAIEELALTFKGDRRWRIEQNAIVDPADQPRIAATGTVMSMQPAVDGRVAEARLGPARLTGVGAWPMMLAARVPLAFGSDGPVNAIDPFAGLAAAIGREGQPASPAQALAATSRGGAFAAFAEDRIGTLEPGKAADFLLIDRDIMTATPSEIAATKVLETWIGGKRIYVRE